MAHNALIKVVEGVRPLLILYARFNNVHYEHGHVQADTFQ